MNLLDLLLVFVGIGFSEAIVKPIAKRWMQRRILSAAPAILREVDRRLPELITLPTGKALEQHVQNIAEEITGEEWSPQDLDPLFALFDLRKAIK